jgi:hypothetical protein
MQKRYVDKFSNSIKMPLSFRMLDSVVLAAADSKAKATL